MEKRVAVAQCMENRKHFDYSQLIRNAMHINDSEYFGQRLEDQITWYSSEKGDHLFFSQKVVMIE